MVGAEVGEGGERTLALRGEAVHQPQLRDLAQTFP